MAKIKPPGTVSPRKKLTPRSFIVPAIFAVLGAVLGGWFVYHGVSQIWKARESSNWPATTGKIIQSEMPPCGKSGQPDCHPIIVYDYQVNGIVYSSSLISPTREGYYSQADANSYLTQFAVGNNVQVFYNPTRPESAILVHGKVSLVYIALTIGGLFFLFCPVVIVRAAIFEWHRRKS